MPVTGEELGRRIKTAREACGLTQEQVANHLGVSRPTIGQIEAGRRSVSSLELDQLAYFFGRDLREFVAESFEEANPLTALFRMAPVLREQPEVTDTLRAFIAVGRELAHLESLLGIDREAVLAPAYVWGGPGSRWEAIQQGEKLAATERRRLELGDQPLPDLPGLLESQGLRTETVQLPEAISGLTLKEREAGWMVVVNQAHHPLRRRFSFAHEYAHVLADRERLATVSRQEDRENHLEVRANAFAAAFLMPEEGVRQFLSGLGKGKPSRGSADVFDEIGSLAVEGRTAPGSQTIQLYDLVLLAHAFGVSRKTAVFRLLNLKLIARPEAEHLGALEDQGKGRQLAACLLPDELAEKKHQKRKARRFGCLAFEAFRRNAISRKKLEELCRMVQIESEALESVVQILEK